MADQLPSEQLEYFRQRISEAKNGDEASIRAMRIVLSGVADNAPVHSLLKICDFIAGEIWADACKDAAEQN